MIFAVKLFSGILSQFFVYLISIFSFFWFGKWIAKTTCQKLDLAVNVQLMLSYPVTYRSFRPYRLQVRGRDTKHVSCVCLGERQTCERRTTGVALERILLFRVFEWRETLKTNILVTSSARESATTLTLLCFSFIINKRADTSLLAEVSHDEAKMRERRESLSFLSFLPRRERPLLTGKADTWNETV